ncbi:hypothetical protein [Phaeovulum sp.]|uniref:hypothetical protein n=1 Tax=Phaeovulum sp. TaxID=2934796 RepID=UPI0039E5B348
MNDQSPPLTFFPRSNQLAGRNARRLQTAEYIAQLTRELCIMAATLDQPHLSFLLSITANEAERIIADRGE